MYPGPKGLGLIEASKSTISIYSGSSSILGRKAWASLKQSVASGNHLSPQGYPGPKGLGLIEAADRFVQSVDLFGRILGRKAWASLKQELRNARTIQFTEVSWAERPGPH